MAASSWSRGSAGSPTPGSQARGSLAGRVFPPAPISGWPSLTSSLPRSRPMMQTGASSEPAKRMGWRVLPARSYTGRSTGNSSPSASCRPPRSASSIVVANVSSLLNWGEPDRRRSASDRRRPHRTRWRSRCLTVVNQGRLSGRIVATNRADGPGQHLDTVGQRTMTRIAIYDTTLRDGSQGEGVNFSLQDKLLITARLDELGVDYIEGGYPLSNPKDAAYFHAVRELSLKHAQGRGLRHDPAPRHRRRGRPGDEGPGRRRDAGGDDRRQDAGTCTSTRSSASRSRRTCG